MASVHKEITEAPATATRRRKAGRINYIVEHATPAMLCLVRAAEPKPYVALSPEALADAVQPHDHSLRPSSYIAHQALIDFYKACDGFYGIDREETDVQQLAAFDHKKTSNVGSGSGGVGGEGSSGFPGSIMPGGLGTSSPHHPLASAGIATSSLPPLPSPDDPNLAEKLNEYRIAQLRRNAQHVDNTVYHHAHGTGGTGAAGGTGATGLCHFYRTAEGCLRGSACPFLHLDKNGQPAPKHARSS